MKSEGATAEQAELFNLATDSNASVLTRDAAVVRNDQHFSRPVADPVDLERNQWDAPRGGDDAFNGHGFVGEFAGVGLHFGNRARAHRGTRAACRGSRDDETEDEVSCATHLHFSRFKDSTVSEFPENQTGYGRIVNVRPKGGDASACLIVRPPVNRRSLAPGDFKVCTNRKRAGMSSGMDVSVSKRPGTCPFPRAKRGGDT